MNDGIDILRNSQHAPIRKEPALRCKSLRDFVRENYTCLVRNCSEPVTVAHLVGKGRAGNWSSDVLIAPLCIPHHDKQEELQWELFEETYDVDFVLQIDIQLRDFFRERGIL